MLRGEDFEKEGRGRRLRVRGRAVVVRCEGRVGAQAAAETLRRRVAGAPLAKGCWWRGCWVLLKGGC